MPENNFDNINLILSQYSDELKDKVNKILEEEAKRGADELKETSPKRTGGYRKGWSVKKNKGVMTIYNKKRGGLTHLLEKDRRIVDRTGTFHGMKKGTPHIKPVEDKLTVDIEKRIKKELN